MYEEKLSDDKEEFSTHNAKLTTFLGVEYQYYIALDYILKINTWDKCLIEEHGDVTFLDDNGKQILNIEVKHTIEDKELKFHDEIFQKTIKNWFNDKDKYTEKTKLLFVTTRKITEDNLLYKWNISSKEKKYQIVNDKKFREYKFITNYFQAIKKGHFEELKSLFEKIEIIDAYPKYPEIIELIKNRNALKVFRNRKDKNEEVLHKVIGNLHWLITKNLKIKKREKWEITHDEFIEVLREQAKLIRGIHDYAFKELLKDRYNDKKNFQYIGLDIIEIKKEKKQEEKQEEIQIISLTEPMDIFNHSSKSLIYGKAGIGKTTFCEYLSWQWAKNEKRIKEKFDYLIHTSLREWKSGGLKGLIKSNHSSEDDEEILLVFKNNNKKILFLFDGYDELSNEKKSLLRDEIRKNNLQNYIITSRTHGYEENDFYDIKLYEIRGFNDKGIDSFVDNFFDNSEKQKAIKEFLYRNSNIKNICVVPLLLNMICTLWQQDNHLDKNITTTEIYSKIIDNILITHDDENVYFRENRTKIKNILGKLSFESLKNNQVIFSGDLIEELFDYNEIQFFRKGIVPTGLIKAINKKKDILDNDLEFFHLTFQEYFSAYYVSRLSKEEQSETIQDWKFYPHMQMFFTFLGGLIIDKEFLFKEVESKNSEDLIKLNTDFLGFYELNIILISIKEVNEISNERKEKVINSLFFWLTLKNSNKYDYNFLIENSIYISHIVNNDFLDRLIIEVLNNREISNSFLKDKISSYLYFFNKLDDIKFMEKIFDKVICLNSLYSIKLNDNIIRKIEFEVININRDEIFRQKLASIFIRLLIRDNKIDKLSTILIDNKPIVYKNHNGVFEKIKYEKLDKNIQDNMELGIVLNNYVVIFDNKNNIIIDYIISINKYDSCSYILVKNFLKSYAKTYLKEVPRDMYLKIQERISNKNPNLKKRLDDFYQDKEEIMIPSFQNDSFIQKKSHDYSKFLQKDIDEFYLNIENLTKEEIGNLINFLISKQENDYLYEIIKKDTSSIVKNKEEINFDSYGMFRSIINNNYIFQKEKELLDKQTIIINCLISKEWNIQKIIEVLIEKNDNDIFYQVVKSLASFTNKLFYIFEKIYDYKSYRDIFIQEMSLDILFQAYDEDYNILQSIIKKSLENRNPLFVKNNNKLYTIEDGKEICTKKEVNKDEFQILIGAILAN